MLHSICQQIWKTQQWPQDWKKSIFIPTPKKGNAKECSNYCTVELISHASKVMLKFSKPGFNSMWTVNFQMIKPDLEKAEEPEIKLPTSVGSKRKQQFQKKSNSSKKKIHLCFIDHVKAFGCVDYKNCGKLLRDGNTRPPYLPPEKSVCWSRSNS